MGNTAFNHRLPALSTACLASAALALTTLAGTTCEFLEINANPDTLLLTANDIQLNVRSATIGVLCENGFYERGGDKMWEISRIFLVIGLALGSMSAALAWAVSTFLPPTDTNWRLLSTLSSLTAVLQVPVFLLFESEPCAQFRERQSCGLGLGSYYLVSSTVFWVAVTLATQCLDPPLWAIELSAWRVQKEGGPRPIPEEDPEIGEDGFPIPGVHDSVPQVSKRTKKKKRSHRGWFFGRSRNHHMNVKAVSTESVEEDDLDQDEMSPGYYDGSIDSRLVLRVLPNGKIPGDKGKSVASFEDLDSLVQLAEEGKLEDSIKTRSTKNALRQKSLLDDEPQAKERVTILAGTPQKKRPTYVKPSSPSKAEETLRIVGTNKDARVFRPRSVEPPKTPNNVMDAENTKRSLKMSMSGEAILADLQTEGTVPSEQGTRDSDTEPLNGSPGRVDRYTRGLRALTKKVKRERRNTRRKSRRGYTQMMQDDDSYDSPSYMSPPIEIQMENMDMVNGDAAHEVSDDEEVELMDEWEALHAATTMGARKGVQEENGSLEEALEHESIDTYHSDPEPAYYSSDETRSEVSLSTMEKTPPNGSRDEDDSSTLSSSSSTSRQSKDSSKLSRGRGGRPRRRKRRQLSPVGSIKSSASLIALKIDEETDQDIIDEAGEDELGDAYSLTRTKSAPEPRGRGLDRMSARRVRRARLQRDSSPRQVGRQVKPADVIPLLNEADDSSTPEIEKVTGIPVWHVSKDYSSADESVYNLAAEGEDPVTPPNVKPPYEEDSVRTPPRTASPSSRSTNSFVKVRRHARSSSLSPTRTRSLKPVTWKYDTVLTDGINQRAAVIADDSSCNYSSCSNISRRARDFRIRRLKRQKSSAPQVGPASVVSQTFLHPSRERSQTPETGKSLGVKPESMVDSLAGSEVARTTSDRVVSDDDADARFRSFGPQMEDLDLQLIEVRRPIGAEYGEDEASL